tara:strand:- start:6581 stop:6838 length:258 start_codon:yes stop_codon:yes gene_type:complete
MKPHFYYALKHFCNQKVFDRGCGLSEDWWNTCDGICKFEIDHWVCDHDDYRKKFTYHKKTFDNLVESKDNYHTESLYKWLLKREM